MSSCRCGWRKRIVTTGRSEEHTSELQSQSNLVCRLLLEKKKKSRRTSVCEIVMEHRPHPLLEVPLISQPHIALASQLACFFYLSANLVCSTRLSRDRPRC